MAEQGWLSAAEQQAAMGRGEATAHSLCLTYLHRIRALDAGGPRIKSVLEVNPEALVMAAELDAERAERGPRGPLHGVCVLLKDNIDTGGAMHTTAGSLALLDSRPVADAPIVTALREAGCVILGKANLSEWANLRGTPSSGGWSARGGQCLNPHVLTMSPSGSSSGSGASVAAGLTPLAVGSETDGSLISPSHACGIVGVKPTVGLVSRTGMIPISAVQDTAGPMTRTVADAAVLLSVLAGKDDADPATAKQPRDLDTDYPAQLRVDGLRGARIGVLRSKFEGNLSHHSVGAGAGSTELLPEPAAQAELERTILAPLREGGATLVDDLRLWSEGEVQAAGWESESELFRDYDWTMPYEFRTGVAEYLRTRRVASAELQGRAFLPQTLEELADFNIAHGEEELAAFGQEAWEKALSLTATEEEYVEASAQPLPVCATRTVSLGPLPTSFIASRCAISERSSGPRGRRT